MNRISTPIDGEQGIASAQHIAWQNLPFFERLWRNRPVSDELEFAESYRKHAFRFAMGALWMSAIFGTILTIERLVEAAHIQHTASLNAQFALATDAIAANLRAAPFNLALFWIPPIAFHLFKAWARYNYQWIICTIYTVYFYRLAAGIVDGTRSLDQAHISFFSINVYLIIFMRIPFRYALLVTLPSYLIISVLMVGTFHTLKVLAPVTTVAVTVGLSLYLSWYFEERERALFESRKRVESQRQRAEYQAQLARDQSQLAEEQASLAREESKRAEEQKVIAQEEFKRAETSASQLTLLNKQLRDLHTQRELLIRALHHDANQPLSTMGNLLYAMEMRANTELSELKILLSERDLFIKALHHDANNPLSVIGMRVFNMQAMAKSDSDDLVVLSQQTKKLQSLIAGMYDLVTLGAFVPSYTAVSVNGLLQQLIADWEDSAKKKHLRLVVKLRKLDVWVSTDKMAIWSILSNLVSNAIKYTLRGSVIVGSVRHGNTLRIDVHDTGVGIPKEAKEKIYREFTRLQQDGVCEEKGLGLGLAIVNLFREKLRGHYVDHYSIVGRGTRFSVDIPLAQDGDMPKPASLVELNGLAREQVYLVVVEDEESVRRSLRSLFLGVGFIEDNLRFVSSKEELMLLFEHACHRAPNVVVSDFRLGGDDTANDVVRIVREVFAYAIVPIVIYSAEIQPIMDSQSSHVHVVVKSGDPIPLLQAIYNAVILARQEENIKYSTESTPH